MHLRGGGIERHYPKTPITRFAYPLCVLLADIRSCYLKCDLQVRLMCSFCKRHDETEVPDPYYGGPQGFEKVIQINISRET